MNWQYLTLFGSKIAWLTDWTNFYKNQAEDCSVVVYGFYLNDSEGNENLVGMLPERRKDTKTITKESVLKLGKMVLGDSVDNKNIIIKQVTIDDITHQVFEVNVYFNYY